VKKRILLYTLFLLCTCFSSTLLAQSASSCYPNISPRGNTVNVTITGVGVDFTSVTPTSVQLIPVAGGSTISTPFPTPVTATKLAATISIPAGATLGDYNLQVLPMMPTATPSMFFVSDVSPSSTGSISGHIFLDENSNCIQEGAEVDYSGCVVAVYPDSLYAVTDPDGVYHIDLPPGSYTVDAIPGSHKTRLCPTAGTPVTITAPGTSYPGTDFVCDYEHVTDASIYCSLGFMRPGFDQTHYISVHNDGFLPINGEVKFVMSPVLTYLSSTPTGTLAGTTVTWTISPPIAPGTWRTYTVNTHVPVSTPLGTPIHCDAIVIPTLPDVTPANDTSFCEGDVVGSYDPNDKTVWDQDMNIADPYLDLTDSLLYYRIRFQNTGTASAINVFIRDTLDPNLDASTLQTVGTSHTPWTFNLNGEGNLEWRFPGIELPDSFSNEPASHGYVSFKVKIKPSFDIGAFIRNKAAIYFDFNDPVITNETFSSVLVSVGDPSASDPVKAYPNPASDLLHVELACSEGREANFALLSQTGQKVATAVGECDGLTLRGELRLTDLAPGIYVLETTSGDSRFVKKIVILH
jgi:hypothetical protein